MIVDDKTAVPALERGIQILQLLAGPCSNGARAAEILVQTRIPPASFYRILKKLTDSNFLQQNAHTGRYHLGPSVMFLGFQARVHSPLVRAAMPALRELSSATHHMTEIAAAIGDWQLTMLETWLAERSSLRIIARPGLLFPLNHLTAPGLVHLAFAENFDAAHYTRIANRPGGRRRLGIPHGVPADLPAICQRTRTLGYCWYRQSTGNTRVSAPVFDPANPKRLLGAISVVCEHREFSLLRAARWAPMVKVAAEDTVATLQRATLANPTK